ncbi:MAG: SLC13 family permease [Oscillospiraceae bacterium]|nr:SLC13 family permease [Oscillospiraceae bacterium]
MNGLSESNESKDIKKNDEIKKLIIILCALLGLIVIVFLPAPPGLSIQGKNTLGLTVFFLVLLIARPVSMPVICLMLLGAMPLLRITEKFEYALKGFSNPVPYFCIASMCLSCAFVTVPLSNRFLKFLLTHFAKSTKSLILSIMICESLVATVISSVPSTAVFVAISLSILQTINDEKKRKSIGRAMILGNIFSNIIGGIATPAGSSLNMLTISILRDLTGKNISFVQWTSVGLPMVIVLVPFAWFLIIKIFKPADLGKEDIEVCINMLQPPQKIARNEILFMIIFGSAIILWILSSWVRVIDISVVAVIAASLCFLPGLNIISTKDFATMAKWDVFFIQGTALTMGSCMINNGVDKWLSDIVFGKFPELPMFALIASCAFFVFAMLLVIPVAPAMIAIFAPQYIAIAGQQNISPVILMLVLALCAKNCFLLPLDTVPIMGLQTGYFTIPEIMKPASILQLSIIFLLSLWIPVICRVVGLL